MPYAVLVLSVCVGVPAAWLVGRAVWGFVREPWLWVLDGRPAELREITGAIQPWMWRRPPGVERSNRLYVARRGKGKSVAATYDMLVRMRRGEKVYSNIEVCDARYGLRAGRVYNWAQVLDLRDCTVFIDEVSAWTDARDWQSVTPEQRMFWRQSRKDCVGLTLTTIHEDGIDKSLRQLLDDIVIVERPSFLPRWVPLFWFQWTYLEQIEEVRRGEVSSREWLWMPDEPFYSYDTQAKTPAQLGLGSDESPAVREPARMDRKTGAWVPWSLVPAGEEVDDASDECGAEDARGDDDDS